MKPVPESPSGRAVRALATNRRAFRDYQVLETLEAGLELRGSEVKSIRGGHFSVNEAYARLADGQAWLVGFHVNPYEFSRVDTCDPLRPKRLLLHRREIERLAGRLSTGGLTLVPLKLYVRRRHIKAELGLCRGKRTEDKREALRRRTADREAERAIAAHSRGRRS